MAGKNPLEGQLRALIRSRGPLNFAEFMSHALYDPEHGYYRPSRSVVGKGGDFYTSVSATPLFARLLLGVIERYARDCEPSMQLSVRRTLHEFGAHRGQLRADLLAISPQLDYHSYESHDAWPERMEGCVVANELLDALPFHRLKVVDGRWRELYVDAEGDAFGWVVGDISDPELLRPLAGLPLEYMEGYTTEVNIAARRWIERLGASLERGLVFLFDYGHETETYFAPHRKDGGLRTFKRHERGDDPLVDIGERDITCDVDFSDVMATAERCGFERLDFVDQGRFFSRQVATLLREAAIGPHRAESPGDASDVKQVPGAPHSGFSAADVRGMMTLTHPAHLGMAFKVLVLRKG